MNNEQDLTAFSQENVLSVVAFEFSRCLKNYPAQSAPQCILLAGQPGAGKTELSTMMAALLNHNAAFINGDDYRRAHPHYQELCLAYGSDAVEKTSRFSSAIAEQLIERLSDEHMHMVVEGTGRSVDVPKTTAELLSAKGYSVQMAIIATRPEISLISTLLRFYQMNEGGTIPRATAITAHDQVVSALPANLDVLCACPSISRMRLWDRELRLLFDSEINRNQPGEILLAYWNRPWDENELQEAQTQVEFLRNQEQRAGLGQSAAIEELARRIGAAAQTLRHPPA